MTMWVWRLSPVDSYYDVNQVRNDRDFFANSNHPNAQQYANLQFTPARRGECREWLINEIFNKKMLRQGWCGIGLDLNLPEQEWIRNYQIIDPNRTQLASIKTRSSILSDILNIRAGDTIFLPKVGNNRISDEYFSVVTAAGNYFFDDRLGEVTYWRRDFGHVIPLNQNLTRTFLYGSQHLDAGDFRAPFIQCVRRVPYADYRGFGTFLRNQNYPFIYY